MTFIRKSPLPPPLPPISTAAAAASASSSTRVVFCPERAGPLGAVGRLSRRVEEEAVGLLPLMCFALTPVLEGA